MSRQISVTLAVLCFLSFGPASAAPARLAPAQPGDLVAPALVASDAPSLAPEGGPVRMAWATDQSADDLDTRPRAHVATSTAWGRTVDAAELQRGLAVPVSRPGALLKLSPQGGAAVDATALTLVDPRGVVHAAGDGLRALADGAFVLDAALGAGTFTVRAALAGPVRVDLLERGSDLELHAGAARDVVFVGDELAVTARLLRAGRPQDAKVSARLVDPAGKARTVALTRGRDGAYHGSFPVRGRAEPGVMWTLEFTADAAVAGAPVRRTTTTSVAVAVPTARLTGAAEAAADDRGVHARLAVEVASPGRYAVSATLYGTNREGALQPIAVGQSADQLTPGGRHLELEFDAATVAAGGLRAPFELRDLRLVDQGRLSVLHRQARGLAVPAR
jgi:hypothetical protein